MTSRDPIDLAAAAPWAAAERALARPLADLAALFARLDERLASGDAGAGWARLAAGEAAALARAAGARVTVVSLLLWRHGAPPGRASPRDLAAAGWALRRLAAPAGPVAADVAGLRAFLGLDGSRTDPALAPLLDRATGAEGEAAAAGFLADLAGLSGLHPLTRAAAALALWRAHGAGGAEPRLEGAVLAARIGAAGFGGARFLPLGGLPRPAGAVGRGAAAAWLAAVLAAGLSRLPGLLAEVAARRDWAARSEAHVPPGRVARAVLKILADEPVVSANLLRDRLGISQQAANAALVALGRAGLAEEVSGQRRYRVWQARI